MKSETEEIVILMADDDLDDQLLTKEALAAAKLTNNIYFVNDGAELLDFLYRRGKYSDPKSAPRPGLILLDLNMPRMDGREALEVIKEDKALRKIPVVVLTTSNAEEDIVRTYDLGVNSFISKPVSFDQLTATMKGLAQYWFSIVKLPR
jgi:CheY-like chemotaxis protein